MNKKIIYLFLFFILLPWRAYPAANTASDIEGRYDKLSSWGADFSQITYVEMLKQQIQKKGRIFVSRPDKIHIEYLSDPKKIYASNGKKLWVYKNEDLTAWQFDKPGKIISKEALSFLSGLKNMSSIFDVNTDKRENKDTVDMKDKTLKKIYLTPKSQDAVFGIILGADAKNTVKEAILFNTSGNITHYVFSNIVFDEELSADLFELPKEPKRKIIKK